MWPPNGGVTWYAAGNDIGLHGVKFGACGAQPAMAYTLDAPAGRADESRMVVYPAIPSVAMTVTEVLAPHDQVAPTHCQSFALIRSPPATRPCALIVAEPLVPVGWLTCATTTLPVPPSVGSMTKAPPSVTTRPLVDVHEAQSMPTVDTVAEPSVDPTLSHESNSASGEEPKNAGETPPVSAPNGAATWKAAGSCIAEAALPNTEYRLAC